MKEQKEKKWIHFKGQNDKISGRHRPLNTLEEATIAISAFAEKFLSVFRATFFSLEGKEFIEVYGEKKTEDK